jgi:hypothetical protein
MVLVLGRLVILQRAAPAEHSMRPARWEMLGYLKNVTTTGSPHPDQLLPHKGAGETLKQRWELFRSTTTCCCMT